MRLRNVPGAKEIIADSKYVINEPEELKGKWHERFKNKNPIYLEIGMGKGQFITQLALDNPNINYIGVEKFSSVLVRAIEKRDELEIELKNLYFIRFDAEYILNIFDEQEIEKIYLNFSDPWPKAKHAKRRLTSKEFLARYNNVLDKEGEIIFKTDNKELFEFSLREVAKAKWELKDLTYNLHGSGIAKDNVMTEYEEKFTSLAKPICRLIAYR